MKVNIQIECTAESLNQGDRSSLGRVVGPFRLLSQRQACLYSRTGSGPGFKSVFPQIRNWGSVAVLQCMVMQKNS